jgi:membrane protein required for colicin V production
MNWVDLVVLGVLAVSAALAFLRGFLREALGLLAWIGAVFLAVRMTPAVVPHAARLLDNAEVAEPASFAVVFLVALIVLSIVAGLVARSFRAAGVGGLDRTVGLLFGVLRGATVVSAAYLLAGLVFAPRTWPDPVLQARSLDPAYHGARFIASLLPARFSPNVAAPPETDAPEGALLQATPRGSAMSRQPNGQEDP